MSNIIEDSLSHIQKCKEDSNCSSCGQKVTYDSFKDNLSRKEYTLSGLCQQCMDSIFD
jgi:hypothetical protein